MCDNTVAAAKAIYASASHVTFVGGMTVEDQWDVVDQDERDLCTWHARAAYAHWLGKPVEEVTDVPPAGAVGKARKALRRVDEYVGSLGQFAFPDEIQEQIDDALRALGGETKGDDA